MKPKLFLLFIPIFLLLAGCQINTQAAQEPTQIPIVTGESGVTVEGKLVPLEDVQLSFNMPGMITEVLVEEGESVEQGQVLARLDQRPRLASAVAAAELEVVTAQQALKTLQENTTVTSAAAQQRVASARDAVRYAERYLNNLNSGSRGTDVDKAEANVVLLKDRLDKAREDYAPYENKPEDNVKRATFLSRMADAQRKYDDAVLLLNNLQGTPGDIDLAVAEANLSLAQAELALAEADYDEVKDGPDPDDLQAAQARLAAAEAALTAAQASLADSELTAPFSGTLVRLDLKAGEQAVPGKPVVVLADLSGWLVETEDLNEMEVPDIQVDQSVVLIPDALPDLELDGQVESISQIYEEKLGDVT
ncbi:MAG: HlyD family secretion protein, partial [Anaerolineales bacterium]